MRDPDLLDVVIHTIAILGIVILAYLGAADPANVGIVAGLAGYQHKQRTRRLTAQQDQSA